MRRLLQRHGRDTLATGDPVALRTNDATKPAGECGGVPDVLQPLPRDNERLLRSIFREVGVTEEPIRVAVRHVLVITNDLLERAESLLRCRAPIRRLPDECVGGYGGPSCMHCVSIRQDPSAGPNVRRNSRGAAGDLAGRKDEANARYRVGR